MILKAGKSTLPPNSHNAVKVLMICITHIKTFQDVAPSILKNIASSGIDGYVFCTAPADVT